MKNPSFLGNDDVGDGYEISGTLRLDWDRTLSARNTMASGGTTGAEWIAGAVVVMTLATQPVTLPQQRMSNAR